MSFAVIHNTPKQLKQTIRNEYDAGKSMNLLTKKYKVSRFAIWKLLNEDNKRLEVCPEKLTSEQVQTLVEEYKNGVRIKDLMYNYNLGMTALYSILIRSNTPARTSKEKHQAIVNDYKNGLPKEQIIEKHKITLRTLRNVLDRANYPWRVIKK